MAQMRVFLSHSSVDNDVAVRIAEALRGAGADVWLDENNLRAQQLLDEINHQVLTRPVFAPSLSYSSRGQPSPRTGCAMSASGLITSCGAILPVSFCPWSSPLWLPMHLTRCSTWRTSSES